MKNFNVFSISKSTSFFLLLFSLLSNNFYSFATATYSNNINHPLIIKKQQEIVRLYQKKSYAKACEEIELLLPLLKNRLDRSKFEFYQAYCNFYEKRYLISANQFYLYVKQYPAFPQVEEACFMRGYSLACENVDIRLDQTATYGAICCLEGYLATYPAGAYVDKASNALQDLQRRLMKKSFQAAELYSRLGYYNSAIIAIKNFQKTYPEGPFKEQILRLLIKSYDKLAEKASKKEDKEKMRAYSGRFSKQLVEYLNDKSGNSIKQTKEPSK